MKEIFILTESYLNLLFCSSFCNSLYFLWITIRFHSTFPCWGGDLECKFPKRFSEKKGGGQGGGGGSMGFQMFMTISSAVLQCFLMLLIFWLISEWMWKYMCQEWKVNPLFHADCSSLQKGGKVKQKQAKCSFHLNYKD